MAIGARIVDLGGGTTGDDRTEETAGRPADDERTD
jgi:hypothetical protein